jgi:phosphoribosylanthranilate isomerase
MTTEVKICGLKTSASIEAAIDAGADYIGLVFFEKSPRHLSIDQARPLAEQARKRARIVTLLVNPDDRQVREIVDEINPDFVQLHGTETPERVAEIRSLAKRPVIKAIGVATADDIKASAGYFAPGSRADMIIFDAKPPKDALRPGGHGTAFDWTILSAIPAKISWMLSGGLTPDNVAYAIKATHAPAVDVSSGVESAPGVKDEALIRHFLQETKTAKQA